MAKSSSGRTEPSLGGRSRIWPKLAKTVKSGPRYLLIVFALAGDSTMTRLLPDKRIPPLVCVRSLFQFLLLNQDDLISGKLLNSTREGEFGEHDPYYRRRQLAPSDQFVNGDRCVTEAFSNRSPISWTVASST